MATLAATAVFVSPFLPQKQLFLDFLPGNNYPDSHHLLGVMKFATQISPLLNLYSKTAKIRDFLEVIIVLGLVLKYNIHFYLQVCTILNSIWLFTNMICYCCCFPHWKYIGDLKFDHLKSRNILIPDFLKVQFHMVRFSNDRGFSYGYSISPNYLQTGSFKNQTFLSRFLMVLDKMGAVCLYFK